MATITITVSGSEIPDANNSRDMEMSDEHLQRVLDWLSVSGVQIAADQFNNGQKEGYTPSIGELEWAWVEMTLVNGTTMAEQQHSAIPAQVLEPIVIE